MDDSDKKSELNRWVDIMNLAQGYGGVFNRKTASDKAIVEASTCQHWCESIAAEFGLSVGCLEQNSNDPPDFFVTIEGRQCSVELVQLVDEQHKQRCMQGEIPYEGKLFLDMQWSQPRLATKLNELFGMKGDKYASTGLHIDALVIHVDEPWLTSGQALSFMSEIEIEPHPNILSAFLLFVYEPGGRGHHWPVLRLYGDLGR